MVETTNEIRKKKCTEKFRGFDEADAKPLIEVCTRVQTFCGSCCDNEVDKFVENVLNFICYKGCLNNAKLAEKSAKAAQQDKVQ